MRSVLLCSAFVLVSVSGCGGSGIARVKGQIVENGQSKSFPSMQAAVAFTLIGADGKPDNSKSYTAVLNPDGTFEVVASGGELPIGTYAISLQAMGKTNAQFKGFGAAETKIRRELKSGQNDLTIDLARPEG